MERALDMFRVLTGETAQNPGSGSMITTLLMLGAMGLVLYFFMYRPQKKQEREHQNMRDSLAVGDEITTTGGIIGMVVKVKDDMLLIETSGNRTKLQIQKWAVHSVIEKANEPEVVESKDKKASKEEKIKLKDDKKDK